MLNLNKNLIVLAVLATVVSLPGSAEAKAGYYMLQSSDTVDTTVGGSSCDFNSVKPAPVIYSITPEVLQAGSSSTTIVIKGANLMPCSEGQLNGQNRPTTFVNPTRLIMEVYSTDLANPGQFLVTVVNPGPGGGYSNALTLTVVGAVANANTSGSVQGASTVRTTTVKPAVRKTVTTTASTRPATVAKTNNNTGVVSGASTSNNNTVDLSASAANSKNGFMPDTLVEWLILVVLIFFGIKLFRSMTEGPEKPLKHA